jgi:predicted CoA-binding protein
MAEHKKTVVLGASPNPSRYSYLAVRKLAANYHPVLAIGKRKGNIEGIEITTNPTQTEEVDTVTLYLNPQNQIQYYNYILSLKPKRIIFNPGTENPDLKKLASDNNITTVEACTLIMLSIGMY